MVHGLVLPVGMLLIEATIILELVRVVHMTVIISLSSSLADGQKQKQPTGQLLLPETFTTALLHYRKQK